MSWLGVRELVVRYGAHTAVDGVTLELQRGESVGLVGESGSGKSTLGKALVGLVAPTSGELVRDPSLGVGRVQMIFQDPYASLNPRLSVAAALGEALLFHRITDRAGLDQEIDRLLSRVGLGPEARKKYPHELSGGQRQRVGIARALAVRPAVLIADEPVSALDVSIRAQILNLLMELRRELELTVLLISHDLAVVEHACDRTVVLYRGKLVEADDPYTKKLLAARIVVRDLQGDDVSL